MRNISETSVEKYAHFMFNNFLL